MISLYTFYLEIIEKMEQDGQGICKSCSQKRKFLILMNYIQRHNRAIIPPSAVA